MSKRRDNKGIRKNKSKNSQAMQLHHLAQRVYAAVGIGIFLLIVFTVFNMVLSNIQTIQLNSAMALDQYRIGSKTLTFAVQSYAVTAQEKYHDAYMKELNEDQNRDKARETLKKCRLSDEEWAELDHIAELSEKLVT